MKLSDNYNNMDNDNILEANLLLERIQLQQKYLTNLVSDLGKEINMLVSVSRALLSIMKNSNLTDDTEFESLVNTHHKSIEKIMNQEDRRYKKIVEELKEVNEQIEMIHGGTYGES
tara:strand:- start:164 stop:511 length:348 start_codon:yes stop_codon:yes gene_type:complete